jgi:hypothetical protein
VLDPLVEPTPPAADVPVPAGEEVAMLPAGPAPAPLELTEPGLPNA